MADEQTLRTRFWKTLEDDKTVMLSLAAVDEGHSRPMTAQFDHEQPGPIWFFTTKDAPLVRATGQGHRAVAHLVAKDHELFATVHGELRPDDDRATLERLWNRFVAVWYTGGQDDPQLQLLRLDPDYAQVWLNENNVLAGMKLLLGIDPKRVYKDKAGEVRLPH